VLLPELSTVCLLSRGSIAVKSVYRQFVHIFIFPARIVLARRCEPKVDATSCAALLVPYMFHSPREAFHCSWSKQLLKHPTPYEQPNSTERRLPPLSRLLMTDPRQMKRLAYPIVRHSTGSRRGTGETWQ